LEIQSGWYPDPDGKPADRYWDGQVWTDKTRPQDQSLKRNFSDGLGSPDKVIMTSGNVAGKRKKPPWGWIVFTLVVIFLIGYLVDQQMISDRGKDKLREGRLSSWSEGHMDIQYYE